MVEKTLNFSRKTNRAMQKGTAGGAKNEQAANTYFSEMSELCMMAKEMKSSLEVETESPKLPPAKPMEISDITLNKKFQHYKKVKEQPTSTRRLSLDEFELLEEIGHGKYGKVYMARHKQTNFVCALKAVSK
jgi:hypothetical protein